MAEIRPRTEVRKTALGAIDEDEAREVLRAASGEEPTDAAVAALRNTLASEAAKLAADAGERSRHRGRGPDGEDVGRAAEERYKPMRRSYFRD